MSYSHREMTVTTKLQASLLSSSSYYYYYYSEAKSSVLAASNELDEWLNTQIFSTGWLSNGGRKRNEIWYKGSLGDEDDAWTSNTCIMQRKCAMPHSTMKIIATHDVHCSEGACDMTSILVMAFCSQIQTSVMSSDFTCYYNK